MHLSRSLGTVIAVIVSTLGLTTIVAAQYPAFQPPKEVGTVQMENARGEARPMKLPFREKSENRQLPTLPDSYRPETADTKRLGELERKYGDKERPIRELQKQQAEEIKAKRESVRSVWKICDEKIKEYRKSRSDERKETVTGMQCTFQPIDASVTGIERTAAQKEEAARVSACRKELTSKMQAFDKETRMQVIALQKSCMLEAQKPATTPQPSVQGFMTEDDEVPTYDFATQVAGSLQGY